MKIALCQTSIVWENKAENIKRGRDWCKAAAEEGARLICFPEMSFTGFSMNTVKTAESEMETVRKMLSISGEYRIAIAFGWAKAAGKKAENHYTVVDGNKVLGDYVKLHPFSYSGEDRWFQKGSDTCLLALDGFVMGLTICYDLRFPELYQELSKSADLILVPANWPAARSMHWKCLLQARAIENQCYVAGINCQGDIGGLAYSGDSCLFLPDGQPGCGFARGEELLFCDLRDKAEKWQQAFPVKQDRRPQLYAGYYDIKQKDK
ncbi:N-carbamoyl-D-amino acid hydrolase [uncultured Roseburia sp.]|uniref:Carbon-nitrogen family hydrolase n=1 Tax=Brotonthovivens ammoniilytica TaxID=2981725 RepID=A0ABT2TKC7_9FIRM|nr:nitrilase-related carbon-nitrogen hydrolase [Brotonthovivens ammoniilytica]MCU6762664.1 carbon-nitrogen family hydrolase [Brotonthovivens ammoniilytica]SCI83978.1 N-carbamoyl-D-amino acid hydrolase [uncultured Roseburia sp.]